MEELLPVTLLSQPLQTTRRTRRSCCYWSRARPTRRPRPELQLTQLSTTPVPVPLPLQITTTRRTSYCCWSRQGEALDRCCCSRPSRCRRQHTKMPSDRGEPLPPVVSTAAASSPGCVAGSAGRHADRQLPPLGHARVTTGSDHLHLCDVQEDPAEARDQCHVVAAAVSVDARMRTAPPPTARRCRRRSEVQLQLHATGWPVWTRTMLVLKTCMLAAFDMDLWPVKKVS